jgi:hypothetical protein
VTAVKEISKYVRFYVIAGVQMGWKWHRTSTRIFLCKGNENHELGTGLPVCKRTEEVAN